ncbi:hypothetical protein PHMEG_00011256 [Phytophthora megakarya]|uniref:Eukaryotic/viral aspartic protease n=1 Tax=Phytophthora megakarya TaxID=4795 RepID=A0A225WD27_9STRA|nr:hypothetical protein PHMEG_00011256 [Phytophthora megakarya]
MLEARSMIRRSSPARISHRNSGRAPTDQPTATESSDRSVEREANKDPATTQPQQQGSQDVELESIRSSDRGSRWEYDPDDVDFPTSAQATCVRFSASSDLKEFTGKDQDEDRALAWISKVKSAFMLDQASDDEKCLNFADLLAESTMNWYRPQSRSSRNFAVSRSSTVGLEYQ